MQRYNNWMTYSFDGVEYGPKLSPTSKFVINLKPQIEGPLPSYKDALMRNARLLRDSYSEPFDVLLSGGIDSEVVVRTFKECGIKHNTVIFRLENDYNIRDVTNAIKVCENLNLKYKIIDFNLQKFFENDAMDYFQRIWCPMAGRLPRLKWIDMLDNIPVFGEGEPYIHRELKEDYSKKSNWHFVFNEIVYSSSIYSRFLNRTVIGDWYEFTPEVLLSFYELDSVNDLINDKIPGKLSSWSIRSDVHKMIWPDIQFKEKLVGYEGLTGKPRSCPDFMTEFYIQNQLPVSAGEFYYTKEELFKALTL